MRVRAGIFTDKNHRNIGWKTVCESEALPHEYVNSYEAPVILFEGEVPTNIENFLMGGGTAVISGADHNSLPCSVSYRGKGFIEKIHFKKSSVNTARVPSEATFYEGDGWGRYRPNENRELRNSNSFPLIQEESYGKGSIFYSGVPLAQLITSKESKKRRFNSHTSVTERVSQVDKAKVEKILIWMLRKAFSRSGLPYVHYWYYPDRAPGIFNFRIDVDGTVGHNLARISEIATRNNLPINFFLNRSKCLGKENFLKNIDPFHVIGCHGDKHKVFKSFRGNLDNIGKCESWLKKNGLRYQKGFTAPRGEWNNSLGKALKKLGIKYSTDFGLKFDGLPFFPRIEPKRSFPLQLPVHPFSVERAFEYYKKHMDRRITPNEVTKYFKNIIIDKYKRNEPVLLYSHPRKFGEMVDTVLPQLSETVDNLGIIRVTLEDFASWWKKRDDFPLVVDFNKKDSSLSVATELPDRFNIRIISNSEIKLRGNANNNDTIREYR